MNTDRAQDSSVMEASQMERTRSRSDIQTQRLKNRERQRRYRARKRLESDMKKSGSIMQSTPPAPPVVEVQLNAVISNYIPRVYCKRDWKKDARRAHVSKDPEVTPNGCAAPTLMPTMENETVFLPGNLAEPVVDSETHAEVSVNQINSEMHRPKIGRRDWKADARKKTNESGLQIGKGLSW